MGSLLWPWMPPTLGHAEPRRHGSSPHLAEKEVSLEPGSPEGSTFLLGVT